MKIINFRVYQLTNGAHFAYMQAIINRAQATEAVTANCKPQLDALKSAFQTEDEILLRHRKNLLSDTLAEADAQRDRLYTLMRSIAKGSRELTNAAVAEAAKVIYQVIKEYGWISTFKYDRQTGMLANLCQDLQGPYAADIQTLGLTQMVADLKAANEHFAEVMAERTDSVAGQMKGEMVAARKDTDNAYFALIETVNALSVLASNAGGANPYRSFVEYVNAEIDRLKRTELRQRVRNETAEPTKPDQPGIENPADGDDPDYPTNPDEGPEDEGDNGETGTGSDSDNDNGGNDSTGGNNPGTGNNPGSGSGTGIPIQPGPGGDDPDLK